MPKVQKPIVNILKKKLKIESERFGANAFEAGKIANYNALKKTIVKLCTEYLINILGNKKYLLKSRLGWNAKGSWEKIFRKKNKLQVIIRDNEDRIYKHQIKHHVTTDSKSFKKLFGEKTDKKEDGKEIEESKFHNPKTLHTIAWCLEYECWEDLMDRPMEGVLLKLKENYIEKKNYTSLVNEIEQQIEDYKAKIEAKQAKKEKLKKVEFEKKSDEKLPNENIFENTHQFLNKLRAGSEKYFNDLRGIYGRFHHLNISEILLPKLKSQIIRTTVNFEGKTNISVENCVQKFWQDKYSHFILVGEGGMGKTVSLLKLWEDLNKNKKVNSPIPIYIPLNEYNNSELIERKDFILRFITRNYLRKRELAVEGENDFFQFLDTIGTNKKNDFPSIILLLDGFNEITIEKSELLKEIKDFWLTKSKGLQIIVTSRYDLTTNFVWQNFRVVNLEAISESKITKYLKENNLTIPLNNNLYHLLANPMMLTLYASTCEIKENFKNNSNFEFKTEINSQGELMWDFIEAQFSKYFENNYDERLQLYYKFLLKHLLPSLGYEMERKGKYDYSIKDFNTIIESAIRKLTSDSFLNTFSEFRKNIKHFGLSEHAPYGTHHRAGKIEDVLCKELKLMVKENNSIRFLHEHFRDFFSVVHLLNCAKVALTNKTFPIEFENVHLEYHLKELLSEIVGEQYNKPELNFKDKRWSIDHVKKTIFTDLLDLLRNNFEGKNIGLIIRNVLQIIEAGRKEMTGIDFSFLDLRQVRINGRRFFRVFEDNYLCANFEGALLNDNCFEDFIFGSYIPEIIFSDDKFIYVTSFNSSIEKWSTQYFKCVDKLESSYQREYYICFVSKVYELILAFTYTGLLEIWSMKTGSLIEYRYNFSGLIRDITFNPKEDYFITTHDGSNIIQEWSIESIYCINKYEASGKVLALKYNIEGTGFIASDDKGNLNEWHVGTRNHIFEYKIENKTIDIIAFSPDGKNFITGTREGDIYEWTIGNNKCIFEYITKFERISCIKYSPDGENFLVGMTNGKIREWKIRNKFSTYLYEGHHHWVENISFPSSNDMFLSYDEDTVLKKWSRTKKECLNTFIGHIGYIRNKKTHGVINEGVINESLGSLELFICNCSFRNLNEHSELSEDLKKKMIQYGALLD